MNEKYTNIIQMWPHTYIEGKFNSKPNTLDEYKLFMAKAVYANTKIL
jgi:hypothetical protein